MSLSRPLKQLMHAYCLELQYKRWHYKSILYHMRRIFLLAFSTNMVLIFIIIVTSAALSWVSKILRIVCWRWSRLVLKHPSKPPCPKPYSSLLSSVVCYILFVYRYVYIFEVVCYILPKLLVVSEICHCTQIISYPMYNVSTQACIFIINFT